ncbi:peroxiredoxin [Burkholderiaceae bacterium DAT-1]|nr:peroxiredoxin [Burkholderiaceae bacterium DAT-1]
MNTTATTRLFAIGSGLLTCLSLSLPAQAALNPGAVAPDFTASAALNGQAVQVSLKDALRQGPVVVYFYPSAFTKGCNIEAHTFATRIDAFRAAHASVVGVSLDDPARLKAFSADPEYCAGKLPVAADPDGRIAKLFAVNVREVRKGAVDTRGEAIDHGFAERVSFVIAQDGHIAVTLSDLPPDQHVEQALQAVQKLQANTP